MPAGDPAVSTPGPFVYIADPGDGTGIQAAFALAAVTPGDVWIRPGLYDLGAGAAVAPLVAPPGITVEGAGMDTVIRSKAAGDQGVIVLSSNILTGRFNTLRNLTIEGVAPSEGLGSTALVRCTDPSTIEDVDVRLVTSDAGTLRDAIRFESSIGSPLPLHRVVNVRVGISTNGQEATPVSGLHAVGGCTVAGQHVEVYDFAGPQGNGFDHALLSEQAAFVINIITVFGYTTAAIASINGGAVRIDEGLLIAGSPATAATNGVALTGGGHVLRSLSIQGSGITTLGTGIALTASPGNVEVDDVNIEGYAIGVDAGDANTGAFDVSVVNSTFNVRALGIRIRGGGQACHLKGNTIFLNDDGVTAFIAGIHLVDGINHQTEGNVVNINGDPQNPQPAVHGIWCQAQLGDVTANKVTVNYCGYGIEIDAERVTVTGNTCSVADGLGCIHVAPAGQFGPRIRNIVNGNSCTINLSVDPAPLPACIVYEGVSGTVNNNACFMGTPTPPHPGIVLTAASSTTTCVANVSDGSAGAAVIDLGAGNEIAHNVGV